METLKYTVIKDRAQYNRYCQRLEELLGCDSKEQIQQDEIDLLTLLIEKWDEQHNTLDEVDPIRLLRSLMTDHKLKSKDLVDLLHVSKGYVSEILNYKKGLSKDAIRILAKHFNMSQEAFNKQYPLHSAGKSRKKRKPASRRKTAVS